MQSVNGIVKVFDAAFLAPATSQQEKDFKASAAINHVRAPRTEHSNKSNVCLNSTLRQSVEELFKELDRIRSGGGNTEFYIVGFAPAGVRIKSTNVTKETESLLRYDKLGIIVDNLAEIEKMLKNDTIQRSVQYFLKKSGLNETFSETYLLGFAREYAKRKKLR